MLYESYQVEKLRKWAPVRTYFGDLGKKASADSGALSSTAHAARDRRPGEHSSPSHSR